MTPVAPFYAKIIEEKITVVAGTFAVGSGQSYLVTCPLKSVVGVADSFAIITKPEN